MALIDKPTSDKVLALDDTKGGEDSFKAGGLISFVQERYARSEEARRTDETRWLKAYRNYRGLYGPDVQFLATEKSRVFVKVTKTKVLAAYGQIIDVLFSNNKFPSSHLYRTVPFRSLTDADVYWHHFRQADHESSSPSS